jgi:hypothetical protein
MAYAQISDQYSGIAARSPPHPGSAAAPDKLPSLMDRAFKCGGASVERLAATADLSARPIGKAEIYGSGTAISTARHSGPLTSTEGYSHPRNIALCCPSIG